MKKLFLLIIFISFFFLSDAQLKQLYTDSIKILDFSEQNEKEFYERLEKCKVIWAKLAKNEVKYDELTESEKATIEGVDETKRDYWNIFGCGDSWYDVGGAYKITASSYLSSQADFDYKPSNAQDLNYKNAWVEGASDYGIGEYLVYHFRGNAPRITEIIVVNGYVKSKSAWENNSRVKKIKMYINDEPYAVLNLKDLRAEQFFFVSEPIGNNDRDDWEELQNSPDWTIKFEILDIYKGNKYKDVVISEIYFNGIDVY